MILYLHFKFQVDLTTTSCLTIFNKLIKANQKTDTQTGKHNDFLLLNGLIYISLKLLNA